MRWVIMLGVKLCRLVRDDFDLHHRGEVGRRLGFLELVEGGVALNPAGAMDGGSEDLTIEQVELWIEADGADFVGGHQKLRVLT